MFTSLIKRLLYPPIPNPWLRRCDTSGDPQYRNIGVQPNSPVADGYTQKNPRRTTAPRFSWRGRALARATPEMNIKHRGSAVRWGPSRIEHQQPVSTTTVLTQTTNNPNYNNNNLPGYFCAVLPVLCEYPIVAPRGTACDYSGTRTIENPIPATHYLELIGICIPHAPVYMRAELPQFTLTFTLAGIGATIDPYSTTAEQCIALLNSSCQVFINSAAERNQNTLYPK
ncbi:hypothetical protein Bbelb_035060 [Branchiostoma belcheri]|nr:hypothetical protein Bbelb_035060 [Branchiostoma belcheri]